MLQTNKLLNLAAIVCFLALSLSSLALAQPKSIAKKAEFVVTSGNQSSVISVWLVDDTLAFSPQGTQQIALWHLWKTDHPSFYQVYPEVGYRIEFDRLTSQETLRMLDELKLLINGHDFVDQMDINGKQFELSSLESGQSIETAVAEWSAYQTFDYADIGDNEADPVLGKLIQQGFVRTL